MDNFPIIKAAHHVNNGIHFPDMGKELIAEAFPLGSALYQTCNIHKFNDRRGHFIGGIHLAQLVQAGIRHRYNANIRFDGAKRVICRTGAAPGQGIKYGAFPNIWEPYDTLFHISLHLLKKSLFYGVFAVLCFLFTPFLRHLRVWIYGASSVNTIKL